ncbi:hypothetical protein FBY21_2698 [Pseudomonas sp. SLBN-26]|uniref:hypothetical protein n=1 Tax=Pseudomonadaceae TaxID=135621 RepID=UPI001154E2AD|nr:MULTISPECIES: hypothetical protein [Pseudomonas]MCP1618080.1 hypothetical protein [Pseudomonas otitidis]TQL07318.1 hypothetical protein FBY21_2698 [Pseudomonas sp. SLBN-26]
MSDKKIIKKISDQQIEEGLKQGLFREDGVQIREISTGQIVKILKTKGESTNNIPSTLIQVHHSYVYQADVPAIIDAISHSREASIYDELEEQYNLVLDYWDSYNTYEKGIEKVHQICLEISVSFDNKIRREIEKLDIEKLEEIDIDRFIGSLKSYIKILLSYILSTYILHEEKFSKDKVIISKILNFEKMAKSLYEQILAKSTSQKDRDGKLTNYVTMENSLYSMYLFNDSYDIKMLDRIVSQDSRFSTSLEVIGFFKTHHKNKHYRNHYDTNETLEISINAKIIPLDSNRNRVANTLLQILEDIDKLKSIREEILNLNNISNVEITNYSSALSEGSASYPKT